MLAGSDRRNNRVSEFAEWLEYILPAAFRVAAAKRKSLALLCDYLGPVETVPDGRIQDIPQ